MEKELILSTLTMEQVIQFYAPRKVHKHRCSCPLHNGKDDNFVIYQNSFHCWVCNQSGDVIKFVSLLHDITYLEAMKQIDKDFALGFFEKPTLTQHRKRLRIVKAFQQKEEQEKAEQMQRFIEYCKFNKEMDLVEEHLKEYAPSDGDQELHPLFVEALHRRTFIDIFLELYDWR